MTGIAGFLGLDGRPEVREPLAQLKLSLGGSGVPGSEVWEQGSIGLLRGRLEVTAEDALEPHLGAAGGPILLADVRLDNRRELAAALEVSGLATVSDEELLRRAYLRWGEGCPEHLLGDFAFALWDARERRLFCARDPLGVRPLHYAFLGGACFAFASHLSCLLALDEVPRRLDPVAAADYLVGNGGDRSATLFADMRRLPPAHSLTLEGGRLRLRRYWAPDPERELRFRKGSEYVERFRELLDVSVHDRMRTVHPLGSHLSGGLDSSAISVIAARRLRATSGKLEVFAWDLGAGPLEAAKAVARAESLELVVTPGRHDGSVEPEPWPLDVLLGEPKRPEPALRAAAERGVRVLLSGWGGDELASFNGRGWQAELLRSARLLTLLRDAHLCCGFSARALGSYLSRRVFGFTFPEWRRGAAESLLAPAQVRTWDLDAHWRSTRLRLGSSVRANRHALIMSGHIQARIERWAAAAAAHGIVYAYPLLDRRLVEFCLSVPVEESVAPGWGRLLMRRASSSLLPDAVRLAPSKMAPRQGATGAPRLLLRELEARLAAVEKSIVGELLDARRIRQLLAQRRLTGLGRVRRSDPAVRLLLRADALRLFAEHQLRGEPLAAAPSH